MDLRVLANSATQNINPNIPAVLLANQGWVTGADGSRTPNITSVDVIVQIQAVDQGLLKHSDALNITGVNRSIYLYYPAESVVRATAQGGDIIQFAQILNGPTSNWLITHIVENWQSTDAAWTHCIVTLQQN